MKTLLQCTAWLVAGLLLVCPQAVLGQERDNLYGDHGTTDHSTRGTHPLAHHSFEELASENDIAMQEYKECKKRDYCTTIDENDLHVLQALMADKYWEREVRRSEAIDHGRVAREYAEIGWLSGLWCLQGINEPSIRVEILGEREIRFSTEGNFWAETEPIMVDGSRDYRAETQQVMAIFQELRAGGQRAGPFYYDMWEADLDDIYKSVTLKRIERREEHQFMEVHEEKRVFGLDDDEQSMYRNMSEKASRAPTMWTRTAGMHLTTRAPRMYTKCGP